MRPSGRLPRRPHRRRPRRPRDHRGRRRHPPLQRRLPRPPAAARPHRGRRPCWSALRALRASADETTRDVVDRTIASSRRRPTRRRSRPSRSPTSTPTWRDAEQARIRAQLRGRRRPPAAGAAAPTTCPRATRRPTASSTRAVWSPTATSRLPRRLVPPAAGPRLFRLDRVLAAEVLDTPVADAGGGAAGPLGRALPASDGRHAGHPPARPRGALGDRVLPDREPSAEPDGDGWRSTCASPTRRGCSGCCCGSAPHAHVSSPAERAEQGSRTPHGERCASIQLTRRTMGTAPPRPPRMDDERTDGHASGRRVS